MNGYGLQVGSAIINLGQMRNNRCAAILAADSTGFNAVKNEERPILHLNDDRSTVEASAIKDVFSTGNELVRWNTGDWNPNRHEG